MKRSATRRRPWQRVAVVAVSLVVSLLLAEGLVRWFAPGQYEAPRIYTLDGREVPLQEIVHFMRKSGEQDRVPPGPRALSPAHWQWRISYDRPRWDYFDELGCITMTSNSLGFRDLEFTVEKPADEFRVLALGDSFTFGQGVQLEDTWVQVLERRVRETRQGPVEVINAGFATGGYDPPGYVSWLRSAGVEFSPDLVIVGLCLNDMGNVPLLAYPAPAPQYLLGGCSKLVNYLQRELEQRRLMAQKYDYAEVVREKPERWLATQAALIDMRDLLRERDIEFVVAVLPMMSQLGDDYPYLGLHEMVDGFCRENAIACVDVLPRFRGRAEEDLWAHPVDQHPNHVGHRLIAEGIHEFLMAENLVR